MYVVEDLLMLSPEDVLLGRVEFMWRIVLATVFAPVFVILGWSDDPGVNVFLTSQWLVLAAGVLGVQASEKSVPWTRRRSSRLPPVIQGILVGVVLGAFAVILAEGTVEFHFVGWLSLTAVLYRDLFRAAWERLRTSWPTHEPSKRTS